MKSLYGVDFRYSKQANELDIHTHDALRGLFAEYVKAGYSPRDIAHVMQGTVTEFELEAVLFVPQEQTIKL